MPHLPIYCRKGLRCLTIGTGYSLVTLGRAPSAEIIHIVLSTCTHSKPLGQNGLSMINQWETSRLFYTSVNQGCSLIESHTVFLLPGVSIALLGVYIGNIYLRAQMSVKREKRQVQLSVYLIMS
jgi:hypothetical protein